MAIDIEQRIKDQRSHPVHPFRMLITGVQGDVLYALAHANMPETAAELARRCNRSKTQVQAVLWRFLEANLIERTMYDRWSWNSLNEDHPFTFHIRSMAGAIIDDSKK